MASLGEILKTERERRGRTTSEAAAATRLKIQAIEALERNDFSKIPAVIYGKGFIKLYARYLDLDPQPLIEEYIKKVSPVAVPSEEKEGATEPKTVMDEVADMEKRAVRDLRQKLRAASEPGLDGALRAVKSAVSGYLGRSIAAINSIKWRSHPDQMPTAESADNGGRPQTWGYVPLVAGMLAVLILFVSAVSRCMRRAAPEASRAAVHETTSLRLAEEPPEPYLK